MSAASARPLRVALGEYDIGWQDPPTSLARAREIVDACAAAGADLVVLPEMCTTGFTMDSATYAEPLSGRSVTELREMARRAQVNLLAGVATATELSDQRAHFNSAILFGRDGELLAEYRKQRLFNHAGEHGSYSCGSSAVVVTIDSVRVAPFICFDLRFPELFRPVAPEVDAIVLIANWPTSRRAHWDVLTRARAIENQCYVIAVNRTGDGGGLAYDGGSAAYDPWGAPLAEQRFDRDRRGIVEIDPAEVTRVRSQFPFVTDRRTSLRD